MDFPWEEKVFEKAQRENKPILVSIGYSTCHYCHVHKVTICIHLKLKNRYNIYQLNLGYCRLYKEKLYL
ncbi:DUF255 domain-containing protein [Bacillus halotolerans]|nr:DUF255 domain-containing protein [Bacillus halotolerans]